MPLKSQKQRKYLWVNDPEVAAEMEKKTPKGKKLPVRAPKPPAKKKK
jgi:hypothetical protein